MAIELLMATKEVYHLPSHHQESLFYFLVFCTKLEGPRTPLPWKAQTPPKPSSRCLVRTEREFARLGYNRLCLAHVFEKRILNYFAPYFQDPKPCVMDLFKAMHPVRPQVQSSLTHDSMIKIFNGTLESYLLSMFYLSTRLSGAAPSHGSAHGSEVLAAGCLKWRGSRRRVSVNARYQLPIIVFDRAGDKTK
jgi:hypothetical protein